jgi:hypothetical protein
MRKLAAVAAAAASAVVLSLGSAVAQEPEVRVAVPEVPGGVIVSNCYGAVGRIYGKYTFSFCLKQRATYAVRGGGLRCNGTLRWNVSGLAVHATLRRSSCGNGTAWSADSMVCRPSIILGVIAGLLKQPQPLLDNLRCDYTPAKVTGRPKIGFIAHRQ